MAQIAFFVDGLTEQLFLNSICSGHIVRRLGLNGKSVSLDAIIKHTSAHISSLSNRCYPIIIIIDREKRSQTWEEIQEYLSSQLNSLFPNSDIRVFVCDRMIENWMLFDNDNLKEYLGEFEDLSPAEINGRSGKTLLREIKKDYHETTDGVELLKKMRPSITRVSCPSFNNLYESLSGLKCLWLLR